MTTDVKAGREIAISATHAAMAERLIASGRFQDMGEVVGAALRLLEEADAERLRRLAWLDAAVAAAEADFAAGRYTSIDSAEELEEFMAEFQQPIA